VALREERETERGAHQSTSGIHLHNEDVAATDRLQNLN
jgi:hypothetical protein